MDLTDLKARIKAARAEMEAPLGPGESRPLMPLSAYLDDEVMAAVWEGVRAIREHHPKTFNRYPEETLAMTIVSLLGDGSDPSCLAELATELDRAAGEEGPWLVSTPLTNLAMPKGMISISEGVVLQRGYLAPEVGDEEYNEEVQAHGEIFRALGDYLPPPSRWLRPGRHGDGALDTARTAALLTVETGTRTLAAKTARSKALYALAIWAILAPLSRMRLLPDVGIYGPQPFLHMPQRAKEFDPGDWISKKKARAGSIEHWGEYELPGDELVALPFEALALVRERRSAQALLSASWAIFQAARGSRFLLSERLRHVLVAVETLGEPKPGKAMMWKRWERLSKRHDVHGALRGRAYTEEQIEKAERRLKDARNIATHGSDAVLIDLGFPEGVPRALRFGGEAAADDLGFAALSADLTIMIYAVQHVLDRMLRDMREHDWDDDRFASLFQESK